MTQFGLFNYWVVILLMMTGFYCLIARGNMIKKIMGLTIFQTSVFIMFISIGKVADGATPIVREGVAVFSNPLPHVLVLTAIVIALLVLILQL